MGSGNYTPYIVDSIKHINGDEQEAPVRNVRIQFGRGGKIP